MRIKSDRLSAGKTFLNTDMTHQKCTDCNTTYAFLALGKDTRRNNVICQFCAHPENFEED